MQTENQQLLDSREVDRLVANNLKKKRKMLGLSQSEVATAIGVSTQQVQKYETNRDRISSGRLYNLATVLKTPIVKFYS